MKESYRENLASSSGHKPYAGSGDAPGVARVRGDAGRPLSSEIKINPVCRPCPDKGKATIMMNVNGKSNMIPTETKIKKPGFCLDN